MTARTLLEIAYTPTVNVWWDLYGQIGVVQKMDAAYHFAYGQLVVSPIPEDASAQGVPTFASTNVASVLFNQHSTDAYAARHLQRIVALKAGVAYTARLGFGPTAGGTWRYYRAPESLYIQGKASPR